MTDKITIDVRVAHRVGLSEAVVFEHLRLQSGGAWFHPNIDSLQGTIPYLTHHAIRTAIARLRNFGLLAESLYGRVSPSGSDMSKRRCVYRTVSPEQAGLVAPKGGAA